MDKLQQTVKQGSDGDKEATAALKLCPINLPHWTKIETLKISSILHMEQSQKPEPPLCYWDVIS